MQTKGFKIPLNGVRLRKHILTFTPTQTDFANLIVSWCHDPQKMLVILSGGPGTGKSYVLTKTLECVHAEQCRMSYTARSAQAIGGHTIHSTLSLNFRGLARDLEQALADESNLETSIKKSADIVKEFNYEPEPLIVVIDEVSMIPGWLIYWIIRFFLERTDKPIMIILSGDPHQLIPIQSMHNIFSFPFTKEMFIIYKFHLKESKRFLPEYKIIIDTLRDYIDKKDESGLFGLISEEFPICEDIDGNVLAQANRAMAAKNDRVQSFNTYYLKHMVDGPEVKIENDLILKRGCIVFVTKNGCSSVANGTELEFIRFRKADQQIICTDPKSKREVLVRKDFETNKFPIALGFAATIHKFQGDTIDNAKIVIHLDGNRNMNMVYTAISRVRHKGQIIAITL